MEPDQELDQPQGIDAGPADGLESQYVDYFGVDVKKTVTLPDGHSTVLIQELNEGARRKYLNSTNKDVRVQRNTGDAFLKMSPGDERAELLKQAIVGWSLHSKDKRTGEMQPLTFNDKNLRDFLDVAPPKVVDVIEKEVRKMNPWLMAELSSEDIQQQIDELTELLEVKLREEEGNAA